MALASVVLQLALVVATMLVTATLVVIGPRRLVTALQDVRWRLEMCLLPVATLALVLFLRWSTVDIAVRIEHRVLGNNITPRLFELEQLLFPVNPVAALQTFQSPELTSFFAFVYIYGYAFLLLFPIIAYFALETMDDLSTLLLAFTVNYTIGLACYVLFIAYGPRNFDPLLFEGLLYDGFPQMRRLTNQVNQSTNVFPSLHTSLSMTVFFLAWLTREKYPLWVPVSGVLAISIAVSTMYLGIHWFSDVVAGTVLALISVHIGRSYSIRDLGRSIG
ncbi:phosphatase PAP2 family protein [Natrialba asiatica]|uniref:PA-phosphatase-like phosphoesterase n=1 Tax=Natrialba asiatica (strain ATCC 700177 / DSM 12278 / JCM 9576 / FERM P-10747 / NBRC 102637 / 172P1) TaxID=29540 RepID=M0ATW0_NATA1|nr:phosphatase PAP2 family protein [Natrialba asiatica]ELZ01373.1 PA-phosphatase-like phosphoesterase [Natrialba asiatica DSM 12278]